MATHMVRNTIYLRGEPNSVLDMNTPFAVAGLIHQHLLLMQEHSSIPFEVVKTYDFNTATQLESLVSALHTTARIHLTIRARYNKEPLQFSNKPFFITSSFDSSGLVPLIRSKLSYYDIATNNIVATNKFSYTCIKHELIPVTLYLGAYHNIHDITEIDNKSTSIARCVASALYSFITSNFYNPQQQGATPTHAADLSMESLFKDCEDNAISASDPSENIYNQPDATLIAGETKPIYIDKGENKHGAHIYYCN